MLRRFVCRGLLMSVLGSVAGASFAWEERPEYEITCDEKVQYGTGGGEPLELDLARPVGAAGLRPAVVFIHGGGWQGGNRSHHAEHIRQAARRGYVAATISYRLAPQHVFPAQVEDAKCAVRWLRANAERLELDPKRIGAIGFSAGAHLSMMLGTADKEVGLEGEGGSADYSSKVQAVVAYFGPADLAAEYPQRVEQIIATFLGGTQEEKAAEYQRASPVTHVDAHDAPMLLFHGTNDELVPWEQATKMAQSLTKAGVPGRVELLLGQRHGWRDRELGRTAGATFAFLDEQLMPAESSGPKK